MPKLNIPPTKSSLLQLKRQLAFAEEGYDLLEQKRQILVLELMSRVQRAQEVETGVADALRNARAALREATLDIGAAALDRALVGVPTGPDLTVSVQHLMGLKIARVQVRVEPAELPFGVGGTSASTDWARRRFAELLPRLVELAELQNAVFRLAGELRKTQRRCNALSKRFIPDYRETIGYIVGALEERERESFLILRMIRDRLVQTAPLPTPTT
ncbi:MAG: V-type ATP synthase subunit D [Verrucomicrobia bacterium]|jgi:V/A-type H+-transporting ATPase subunit D|nr:V-type ATP synthase subunit D [Verrucomicrobiota bacterium]